MAESVLGIGLLFVMVVENVPGHTVPGGRTYARKYCSRCCENYCRTLFGTGTSILMIVIIDIKI